MFKHSNRASIAIASLVFMGLGASLIGCTQKSEIGDPEQELSAYGAFPGSADTDTPTEGPLTARVTQPREDEIRSNVVTVSFNKPMVAATLGEQPVDTPLFEIEPKVDGVFSWVGTRMAVFHPNKPFAPATQFKITVPPGIQSVDGTPLKSEATFNFHTPFLKVWATSGSDKLSPDSTINIHFNLPVEHSELKKALHLTRNGKTLETEISESQENAHDSGVHFSLTPVGGFKLHANYSLKIDGSLHAKGATRSLKSGIDDKKVSLTKSQREQFRQRYTSGNYEAEFAAYGDFKVTQVQCGYRDQCTQNSSWTVYFSNPIDPESAKECLRFTSNTVNKDLAIYPYQTQVNVYPQGLGQGQTHRLKVSKDCKDIFGNQLKKDSHFSKKIAYNSPNMQMSSGIRIMESSQGQSLPSIPMMLDNLTRPAKARLFNIPSAQLPAMHSRFRDISATALPGSLASPHTRTLGEDLKLGHPKIYSLDLSNALKKPYGSVYLDLYAPELVSKYHDGTYRSLVVFTDLGLTVKTDARSAYIWVTRLSTGEPVANAEVGIWSKEGERQWSGKTDKNGLIAAPRDAAASEQNAIVTASVGDDISLLDLDEWSGSVGMYGFNIPYRSAQNALEAKNFIFTERGVYKSGDTVHIKGYTRLQNNGILEDMPAQEVSLDILDSHGKNIALESAPLSPLGGFALDVQLPEDAALGTYQILATPVIKSAAKKQTPTLEKLGRGDSGSFRVEAYRTPEFEVLVEPEQDEVMVGSSASIAIRGRYLFGAPMRGSDLTWTARREHSYFKSRDFPKFSFRPDSDNHWYYDASPSSTLSDSSGELSDAGILDIDLEIPKDKDFQGAQSVEIEANITDINRQEISGRTTIKVHPGQYYVGVLQPDYLVKSDETIQPKAIATDHQGRAVAGKKITLRVLRREWKTERKKNPSGDYSWVTSHTDTPAGACTVTSKTTPVSCDFELAGSGSYRVLAESTDAMGHKLTGADSFYAYGGGRYTWDRDDSERIDLVADAEKYKVGDVARILVKSPFERAHALVTVEQGSVLSQFTTDLNGNSATVEIPITDEMKPNAFVSVSLIRGRVSETAAPKSKAGRDKRDPGRPAFKIGYAELKVDHSDKVLAVTVKPERESYHPGEQVRTKIQLRDPQGRPIAGEVTFMAVDQGVLSLTGYETPAPSDYFYAPRPLGVSNRDTRLMLSTRADLQAEQAGMKASTGGGGGGGGVATKYRSDFSAAATFKARVKVDESGEASVDFNLPDNLTAYRLMAVAVASKNRFGAADTRITVNKSLMVRPSLPRFASTGDAFEARAVIQAMEDFKGKVEVQITVDGALSLTGENKETITLKAGGNQEVAFPVSAGLPGDATIRFVATGVDNPAGKDSVEITLPVKYPAAKDTFIQTGTLALDASWAKPKMQRRIELPDTIRKDVGGLEITLSSSQIAELLPGLDFLVDYPYSCAEQVSSRVLGLISMRDVAKGLDLPGLSAKDIEKRVSSGIAQVLAQQTHDGGIGYWAGQYSANKWASVYAALTIVRAREDAAYKFDSKQYLDLLEYLRSILREDTPKPQHGMRSALATKTFAAWVLAEAGVPEPGYHEELYTKRHDLPRFAHLLLAMAMHSADSTPEYRDELLDEVLTFAEVDLGGDGGAATLRGSDYEDPYGWQIWQSPTRENAIALIALMRMRPDDALVPKFAQGLLRRRQNGYWQSTQDTAFSLMALGEYFGRAQQTKPDYEVLVGTGQTVVASEHFEKLEIRPRRVFIPMKDLAENEGQLLTILQKGSGGPLYYSAKLISAPKAPPTEAFDGGFHLKREYFATDGPNAGKAIDSVSPGQVVKVRLTLTVPEDRHYVAVEDPLPAGFEAINTSFDTTSQTRAEEQLAAENDSYYGWWWSYWQLSFDYSEQHDDRIALFKTDLSAGIYRHAYLARATTPGKFTAPAAKVEAMYDPTVYGRSDARNVDID